MNILPHKSWNVWNQKNLDKVHRDELEHEEKLRQQQKRTHEIEQEARLEQLRKKKRQDEEACSSDEEKMVASNSPKKHINFFEEFEEGRATSSGGNADFEKEAKIEEEKKRKQCGTMPWKLGDGSLESAGAKPWFECNEISEEKHRKSEKMKLKDDPLRTMNQFLDKKRQQQQQASKGNGSNSAEQMLTLQKQNAAFDRLRQERIEREKRERDRIAELMGYKKPSSETANETASKYSSGYAHIHGGRTRQEWREQREKEKQVRRSLTSSSSTSSSSKRYFDT